ncbi:hypothetical protein Acor_35890 [Acrocarpospora corrugata]|uniref:Uncharacterized protein n=1 Tax=Acrocarpospora corrugata TaxID=35763 RepID=A0A5M3VXK8_9ACTN|nr:hypothetical protein Acor_35890 [Acrocarpospora corrugata]
MCPCPAFQGLARQTPSETHPYNEERPMLPGCGSCQCSDEILSTLKPPRITQLG